MLVVAVKIIYIFLKRVNTKIFLTTANFENNVVSKLTIRVMNVMLVAKRTENDFFL